MVRAIARGVVFALLAGLAVGVPPSASAVGSPGWGSEQQLAQRTAELDSIEASYASSVSYGWPIDGAMVDELTNMVPQPVYEQYPLLDDLIAGADPETVGAVSSSGASIPGCPPAGTQLMAGFPAPFGFYSINPTNNWCTPNGPDNGCNGVSDNGLTFDFRAACRQHDLSYRWAAAPRSSVDFQLLLDMGADCAKRNIASRTLCYTRAGIRYAVVVAVGWCCYGNSEIPGYNRPVPADGVPPLPAAPTCAQASHARVHVPIGGTTVPRGTLVYLTGVVRKHNRVRFEFYNDAGTLLASHLTYFSDNNCVVRHEPEAFNTNRLTVGTIRVFATYAPWESNQTARTQVATLQVTAGGGATTCNQYSHAWVAGGPVVYQGATVYLTGVVHRDTRITFDFYDNGGNWITRHVTQPARSNCVVHHEPEWFNTARLPIGTIRVNATYLEWETDMTTVKQVGMLVVVEPPPPPPPPDDDPPGGGCGIPPYMECQPVY